jgi:hypothetical protein
MGFAGPARDADTLQPVPRCGAISRHAGFTAMLERNVSNVVRVAVLEDASDELDTRFDGSNARLMRCPVPSPRC